MAVRKALVALALGRTVGLAIDIALLVFLFALTVSDGHGNGQSVVGAFVGLITTAYDLGSIFDPTGFISEQPVVAVGDVLAMMLAISGVVPLAIMQTPPPGASWAMDWRNSYGLLIVFILVHTALGIGRAAMHLRDSRIRKRAADAATKGVVQMNPDAISLNEMEAENTRVEDA